MSSVVRIVRHEMQAAPVTGFDVERVRKDFPILHQEVKGKPLVYLDNGATSQKPQVVIDTINRYYTQDNANVHRGVHTLSERATEGFNLARRKVQRFVNARDEHEIVFVRGTTEAINLVAQTFGRSRIGEGDEIVVTEMEHHSNIVPWQLLCQQTGATLRVVPIDDAGDMLLDEYLKLLNPRTKLVALAHVSNALGTVNPVRQVIEAAHAHGVPVLLDGAQASPHMAVDVQALDCDFYAFSGHKMYAPTGIGVLYGKLEHLEAMPPYQGGGDMITRVSFSETVYNIPPYKFEAGTPNIVGAIGLGAAIDYLSELGLDAIAGYEAGLLSYATEQISQIPRLRLVGSARKKAGILSFLMEDVPAADIGTILDLQGIAIRAGHHCAMPVMEHFGVGATARASLAMYNTRAEVDALIQGIVKAREFCA